MSYQANVLTALARRFNEISDRIAKGSTNSPELFDEHGLLDSVDLKLSNLRSLHEMISENDNALFIDSLHTEIQKALS